MAHDSAMWAANAPLFPVIDWQPVIEALVETGRCTLPMALPAACCQALRQAAQQHLAEQHFQAARIGRGVSEMREPTIRGDQLCWLQEAGETCEAAYLQWMKSLQQALNQSLYLGIHEFEAHFAFYPAGAFYRAHVDRHRNSNARVVTAVLYLNECWQADEGGELLMYDDAGQVMQKELPEEGKLVIFMSEGLLHEVLPAKRERWSIAGWFRQSA